MLLRVHLSPCSLMYMSALFTSLLYAVWHHVFFASPYLCVQSCYMLTSILAKLKPASSFDAMPLSLSLCLHQPCVKFDQYLAFWCASFCFFVVFSANPPFWFAFFNSVPCCVDYSLPMLHAFPILFLPCAPL